MSDVSLPEGCLLLPLVAHGDERGTVMEVYRREWIDGDERVQWNVVHSNAGTLRGVHVHTTRLDYLYVVEGEMWLALYDMRRSSTTFKQSCLVRLAPDVNQAAHVPVGVAHGFYFTKPSITLYGLSSYFSMEDELGCHPDDPALGIEWPGEERLLSTRDQKAGTLEEMQQAFDDYLARNGVTA